MHVRIYYGNSGTSHNRPSESPTKDNDCIYIDQFFVPQ